MAEPTLKPWSQADNEIEEELVASPRASSVESPVGGRAARVLMDRLGEMRGGVKWAFVIQGIAMGWLLWSVLSGSPLRRVQLIGIVALLAVGMAVMVLSRLARRASVERMLGAMETPVEGGHGAPLTAVEVEPEFRPICQAIEQHTENVEVRVRELLEAQQQMTLELTLADAQRKLAASIIAAMSDPVLVTDAFDQLIQANSAAERMFKFKLAAALRKPVVDAISDDRLVRLIRQARETDARAAVRKTEFAHDDKVFEVNLLPLVQDDSEASREGDHGVVVMFRDITREHETSKKKSEFVAHAAHELRTPLSSIRAYVEMLVDGEATDETTRREFYDIIQTSADRLGRLIDNMLNISRIEAGTVRINKEPMAISMVVKEALDMMRPAAEEKKIELTEHLTPVMYRVHADRDLIYQAVLNLISNAIKYTPDGGSVTVRMTPHEENATMAIDVTDTGVGIPKEDLPKMFGKFFRVEANKKVAKGTGLGLNLVKNVIENVHEGQISLESEVGKGSTFRVRLPMMS